MQCPVPSSVTNGRVTPVFPRYLYRDYIQVRCDKGYKLMMVDGTFLFHLLCDAPTALTVRKLTFENHLPACVCSICFLFFIDFLNIPHPHPLHLLPCIHAIRMDRRSRVSLPCVKAMESGTSLCQNATVSQLVKSVVFYWVSEKSQLAYDTIFKTYFK